MSEIRSRVAAALPPEVQSAMARADAEREQALSVLTPAARARILQAEQEFADELIYGNVFRRADGSRIDPRTVGL